MVRPVSATRRRLPGGSFICRTPWPPLVQNVRLFHFVVEVVPSLGTLTTPANTDKPLCCLAMLLISSIMLTVLPAGAAEQADLAALGERAPGR